MKDSPYCRFSEYRCRLKKIDENGNIITEELDELKEKMADAIFQVVNSE